MSPWDDPGEARMEFMRNACMPFIVREWDNILCITKYFDS